MGNPISKTMFLKPVVEQEVLGIVKACKNKTSLDYENLSMYTIKNIIPSIVKPFTYICNLSFLTGIFPDKMKNAKVIPLFKAGKKNYLPTIDLCLCSLSLAKSSKNYFVND